MISYGPYRHHSKLLLVKHSIRARRGPLVKLTFFVGPLAGDFPILSLRTNKADVAVGIPQAVADKLDQAGERWRVNGK